MWGQNTSMGEAAGYLGRVQALISEPNALWGTQPVGSEHSDTRILFPENIFTRNTLTAFQGALGHYRCQGSQWGLKAGSKSMHDFPPTKWENNFNESMITKHQWLGQERCTRAAEQSEQTWALRVHSGRDKPQRNGVC